MTNTRLKEFEALRGLAILLLLALHSEVFDPMFFGDSLEELARFVASFLLGAFFFLAGYFMEISLAKPGAGVWKFIWSKFIRIYPPYWFALALFIFVMGVTLKRNDLLVYLLNLQAVFAPVFVKPVLTLWYISMLVVFYIMYGVMMLSIRSSLGLTIAAVGVYIAAYLAHINWGFFDPRFFQYYFIFLAGVFFCRFESVRVMVFGWNLRWKIILAVMGVLLFALVLSFGAEMTSLLYTLAVDAFILSWVLMWLGLFRTRLGDWRIWAWLSTASFFAYLVHRPMWRVLGTLFALEEGPATVFMHLIPGAILALIVGYYLQLGYDRLLAALRLK